MSNINLLRLNLVCNLDEKVCAVTLIIPSRNKVVETNESQLQDLGLGVLQTSQNNLHDGDKVLFQSIATKISLG